MSETISVAYEFLGTALWQSMYQIDPYLYIWYMSWSRLIGQIGGWFKLFLGFIHAASLLFSIAGASPGNAEISISLYASSGVRPSSAVCGLTVL